MDFKKHKNQICAFSIVKNKNHFLNLSNNRRQMYAHCIKSINETRNDAKNNTQLMPSLKKSALV
jgi:hypothetical protein